MPNWEYQIVTLNTEYETMADMVLRETMTGPRELSKSKDIIEACLEIQGEMGWELAAALPAMPDVSPMQDVSHPNPWVYHFIFKRPV